jgi:hypothetical protein
MQPSLCLLSLDGHSSPLPDVGASWHTPRYPVQQSVRRKRDVHVGIRPLPLLHPLFARILRPHRVSERVSNFKMLVVQGELERKGCLDAVHPIFGASSDHGPLLDVGLTLNVGMEFIYKPCQ